jgi:hypothetical protein
MKNFLVIGLFLMFIGCAPAAYQIVKPYADPQYGMTKMQMFDLLGKPESVEIYKQLDLTRVEFYIYVKKYLSSEEKVPVCVINNKVVGWGKNYYEDHVTQDDIRIR